jgi:hypothetical protein
MLDSLPSPGIVTRGYQSSYLLLGPDCLTECFSERCPTYVASLGNVARFLRFIVRCAVGCQQPPAHAADGSCFGDPEGSQHLASDGGKVTHVPGFQHEEYSIRSFHPLSDILLQRPETNNFEPE